MNDKKIMILVVLAAFLVIAAAGAWLISELPGESIVGEEVSDGGQVTLNDSTPASTVLKTGPINLGKLIGNVSYDELEDCYYLQLKGTRLPFKTSPIEAQNVPLEAPGDDELARNTSLLYGILGRDVLHTTLLVNPDEEDEVMPAATDIAQYIQIANRRKYAGLAYTKAGGKLENSVVKGSQIQTLRDGTARTPIIQIKGPKSGAEKTRVKVIDKGQVVVEGKTYEELYKAADLISITLLKMLCGSSTCPDAAACATGGSCGCG